MSCFVFWNACKISEVGCFSEFDSGRVFTSEFFQGSEISMCVSFFYVVSFVVMPVLME